MLFDTSESMRKDLKLSQQSAVRLPRGHPPGPRPHADLLRPRHPDLALQLREPAGHLRAHPGREGRGLHRALRRRSRSTCRASPGLPGRKTLVVFTDGDDTTSRISSQEVEKLVRSSDATIYPVAFPGAFPNGSADGLRARAFLHSIATLSGGRVFQPTASRELASVYQSHPGRARHAVRARLRVGQPEPRRQVPQDRRRAEAAGPEGPPPHGLRGTEGPAAPQAAERQELARTAARFTRREPWSSTTALSPGHRRGAHGSGGSGGLPHGSAIAAGGPGWDPRDRRAIHELRADGHRRHP